MRESINFRQRGASVYQTLRKVTGINKEESIMPDLTFGEQVKIILSRKGMTIKELAEIIEKRTGKKMSRQNLTQRLGRDNFQEQDMRMIAEILECPFHLSILLDNEAEEAERSADAEKTRTETAKKDLVRIAKAKARKEKKAKEAERLADAIEQIPSEIEKEPNEKEMTLGDYLDIHEELERQETDRLPKIARESRGSKDAELDREEAEREYPGEDETEEEYPEGVKAEKEAPEDEASEGEEAEKDAEDIPQEAPRITLTDPETLAEVEQAILELKEMEKEVELERINAAKAKERQQQEEKKVTGWRAMFQRRSKKEKQEEALEEERIEQEILSEPGTEPESEPEPEPIEIEDDFIDYGDSEEYEESETAELEELEEDMEEYEEPDDEEDLSKGERNPYTGHEYETNSVRMHPKRIGYVQLYDRGDHAWTDMTEWAFLGYQERKKALLGKDYEPPIYLD